MLSLTNKIQLKSIFGLIDQADTPWEWIDAQRGRHPNVNFYDNDNAPQFIKENPAAGENLVNFDMQAESGRLIVGVCRSCWNYWWYLQGI